MTILEPHRERRHFRGFVVLLVVIVAIGSLVNVALYTQTVDLKHRITKAEYERRERTVATAELKDKLYRLLDAEHLRQAASELGLVLETKPSYLKLAN